MLKFLGKLFGGMDRVESASDRMAAAMEGIASDLEQARALLRERIGLDGLPAPAVPALTHEPTAEGTGRKRGKAPAA